MASTPDVRLVLALLCLPIVSASYWNCSTNDRSVDLRFSEVLPHRNWFSPADFKSASGCDAQFMALSWEKAWTSGHKRMQLFSTEVVETPVVQPTTSQKRRRTKRRIFGIDNRVCINSKRQARDYPFSSVVKVSTGCTGTLVAPKYVLTAAHCIHNGSQYLKGHSTLRVGFLRPKGTFRWINVTHTYLPFGWRLHEYKDIGPLYDYAVLALKKRLRRDPIPIAVSEIGESVPAPYIYFSAYPDDKARNTLCYRSCNISTYSDALLYFECDAMPGSSGAGIYTFIYNPVTRTPERRVIGVFSGNRWLDGRDYNVAIRLPVFKYRQVCQWLKGYECNQNDTSNKIQPETS